MLELLQKFVSGFVVLTHDDFSLLAEKIVVRKFDRREQLLRPGEVEQYMNFVVTGLVRMYFYKGKTEVITNIAKEGELVSSSASFLSGAPSNYFIETLEPTTMLSLTRQQLEQIYQKNIRIERLGRLMTTNFVMQKEEWEHECMRLDTRERFTRFMERNPDLVQRVPQKYLASYLNMKPETFSRLKHLTKKRPAASR
jgi:CRP-like cAMP-binding protein